ncbi:MAG: hypothetical protein JWM44_2567 [Bacilli bacterium]|nr:hypothetical protein [Bacilli bacterium]
MNGSKVSSDNIGDLFDAAVKGKIKGDTVTLDIRRGTETKQYIVPFKNVVLPIVTSQWFPEGIGYLSLAAFSQDADKAFSTSLSDLQSKGMKSLIIDLRNNGGGYIETAKKIAAHFMKNKVLMYIKNRDGKEESISTTEGSNADYPIVILVNENSASASEVFAGAMQDYKLATIVGVKTYGKGVTQNVIPLFNGGELKITTEEYFTPNHHSVNHIGLTPDIAALNDVEQLIKAMYAAGAKDISLILSKNDYKLNNNLFTLLGSAPYMQVGEQIYLSSRLLASLIHGNATWDESSRSVILAQKDMKLELPVTSPDMIIRNGTSYMNAAAFASKFPMFRWSFNKDSESVTLEASH